MTLFIVPRNTSLLQDAGRKGEHTTFIRYKREWEGVKKHT